MGLRQNETAKAIARRIPAFPHAFYLVRKWLILRRGSAQLDYVRAPIRIRADTEEIVNMRLQPVNKEPWTVEWIEQNVSAGDVLYDIGANVGVYSLIAATFAPAAQVVAIEPGYATFASLCDNLLLNGVADRVIPLPIVLGAETHLGSFSYRDVSAGAAIHELDSDRSGAYRQRVLVLTLDELLERFDLPAPTLVKLDVDGAEADVLAGARRTLQRPELRSLIVEVEEEVAEPVLRELRTAGFALGQRIDDRYGEQLPGVWYGIFERPSP
jgi:FkbM family methyltransferase